jgi:hypothetical protein
MNSIYILGYTAVAYDMINIKTERVLDMKYTVIVISNKSRRVTIL